MGNLRISALRAVLDSLGSFKNHLFINYESIRTEFGLTPPHVKILIDTQASTEGLGIGEIADTYHVTPGAVTQFVDKLVEHDLVTRYEDPTDRRVTRIKLAPQSKARVAAIIAAHRRVFNNMFENLSDDELIELSRLLQKTSLKTKE